jgi:hypothetical protein
MISLRVEGGGIAQHCKKSIFLTEKLSRLEEVLARKWELLGGR